MKVLRTADVGGATPTFAKSMMRRLSAATREVRARVQLKFQAPLPRSELRAIGKSVTPGTGRHLGTATQEALRVPFRDGQRLRRDPELWCFIRAPRILVYSVFSASRGNGLAAVRGKSLEKHGRRRFPAAQNGAETTIEVATISPQSRKSALALQPRAHLSGDARSACNHRGPGVSSGLASRRHATCNDAL